MTIGKLKCKEGQMGQGSNSWINLNKYSKIGQKNNKL